MGKIRPWEGGMGFKEGQNTKSVVSIRVHVMKKSPVAYLNAIVWLKLKSDQGKSNEILFSLGIDMNNQNNNIWTLYFVY